MKDETERRGTTTPPATVRGAPATPTAPVAPGAPGASGTAIAGGRTRRDSGRAALPTLTGGAARVLRAGPLRGRQGRRPERPSPEAVPAPRRGGGAWAFLLAIATAGALAHVGVRFKSLEVAYALGRERQVGAELEEQRRRLQIEIGMLKDPNRVVSIARDKLHMGPPAPDAIRRLGSGALFVGSAAPTSRGANDGADDGAGRADKAAQHFSPKPSGPPSTGRALPVGGRAHGPLASPGGAPP